MIKRLLKSERGLTLIELLAVVVILGIIAAIAVPSIGGIIDNTKKDAHIANARQMINATRLALTDEQGGAAVTKTMQDLVNGGYMESVPESPNPDKPYSAADSRVVATKNGSNYIYKVYLMTTKTKGFIVNAAPNQLTRDNISLEAASTAAPTTPAAQ